MARQKLSFQMHSVSALRFPLNAVGNEYVHVTLLNPMLSTFIRTTLLIF